MRNTSSQPLVGKNASSAASCEKVAARCWSEAERERILNDHPELERDNKAFIRELLRRHAARGQRDP